MFSSKNEKKSGSVGAVMLVGALALIGAASVTKKGKKLITGAANKVKSICSGKADEMKDLAVSGMEKTSVCMKKIDEM